MKTIGVGIGFRRDISQDILSDESGRIDFIEIAPENWMNVGGKYKLLLDKVSERYPIFCHGLSLSIGSPEPLDYNFLKQLKLFFRQNSVKLFSEHLSFSKIDNAHLHDLLPIPFRKEAVKHVVERIKEVQDILEMKIAIENVSYYTSIGKEMEEDTFISEIIEKSDCNLLLDINNVYVNSFNHQYNAKKFIENLPLDKVCYIHMAGHTQVSDTLIVDTHGENIIDPVFELLQFTLPKINPVPILIERDFNFPQFDDLINEMNIIRKIAGKSWGVYAG